MKIVNLSVRWDGIIIPLALLAAIAPAQAKGTLAGTAITAHAQVTYTDASIQTVQTPDTVVTVDAAPSVSVALPRTTDTVSGMAAIGCTITNRGNLTDTVNIDLTTSDNTYALLVKDDNGDGIWQTTESQVVVSLKSLPPDQPVPCLLVVQANAGTAYGEEGTVTLDAKSATDRSVDSSATFTADYVRSLTPRLVYQAPGPFTSSPTVINNVAVAGSEEGVVYAVNTAGVNAGKLAWRFPADGNLGMPIRSRVASDGNGFYVTANNGWLYHLDSAGNLLWRKQAAATAVNMDAMPLVSSGDVTLACGDGRMRRFQQDTGSEVSTSAPVGGGALTTPSMPGTGDLWVGGADGALYNINADNGYTVMSVQTISNQAISAMPFVDARTGLVLTATSEGDVYALRSHSNAMKWGPVSLGSPVKGSPWVDGASGIAYFGGADDTIHALHVTDGTPVAGYPLRLHDGGGFVGAPVVDPMPDGKSILIAASTSGRLYAFRASDPTHVVQFAPSDPGVQFLGTPALSRAGSDGVLVVAGTDGKIYIFSAADAVAP